jgi:hypothetical protein
VYASKGASQTICMCIYLSRLSLQSPARTWGAEKHSNIDKALIIEQTCKATRRSKLLC